MNLQQLPSKGPLGKLIKSCFVSPQGSIFAGPDYNALEARIDALTTKDKAKLDVFIYGYDVHAYNTYYYWKDKFPEVTLYPNEVEKVYEVVDKDITHYIPKGTVIETPEGKHIPIEEYFNAKTNIN